MTAEAAPESQDLVGTTIAGKFVLRELLGAGAMGTVYRADQEPLGRTVAVKVLNPTLARDPEMVQRFHVEARAASRLNHPNTVAIIDFGQSPEGLLYLVMEFVRSRTLAEVIRQDFPLPTPRLVDLACQILAGLHEAHSQGVVHQDVKPDNILVERLRTGGDLVKIADFGIARLREEEPEGEREVVSGTPEYMAPEQIRGLPVDARTDVYATGVVLYEMITGARPFAGGQLEVLRAHLEDAPPPLAGRVTGPPLNAALERAVMRALRKLPEDRFQSAAELRAVLADIVAGAGAGVPCPACGAFATHGSLFCPGCGVRLAPRGLAPSGIDAVGQTMPALASVSPTSPTGSQPSLPAAAVRFPLPFVGRERELRRATTLLADHGRSRAMVIVGPPGVGKSRLSAAIEERALAAAYRVLSFEPDPTGLARSWYPVRAAVSALLDLPRDVGQAALLTGVSRAGIDALEVPGLAELFGLESPVAEMELAVRRRECAAAALRVLRGGPKCPPTLLVFEDADRFDRPSLDLLQRLVEFPGPAPVHVVLTAVPGSDVEALEGAELIFLERLSPTATTKLLRAAGAAAADAGELAAQSDGLPLDLEQRLRQSMESGAAGGSSLADVVDGRVKALPAAARRVLQVAAVLGTAAEGRLISTLLRANERLETAAEVLAARGFAKLRDDRLVFAHPLVQELVLSGIPVDARRQFHVQLEAILRREGAPAAVVGYHGYHGGGGPQAIALLEQAGIDAQRLFDDAGAVPHYRRAWELARWSVVAGEEGAERDLARLGVRLGEALRYAGDLATAEGVLRETVEHARDEHALAAQALRALGHVVSSAGQPFPRCREHMQAALAQALRSGDRGLVAETYLEWSRLLQIAGDLTGALAELSEGLLVVTGGEGVDAADAPPLFWRMALRIAELQLELGQPLDARRHAEAALDHAHRRGSGVGAARCHGLLADVNRRLGRRTEAARHRQEAVDNMRRLGDRRSTAELLLVLAGDDLAAGARDQARRRLLEAHELSAALEWRDGLQRTDSQLRALG